MNRRKYPRLNSHNLIAVYLENRLVFNLVNISENGVQFSSSRDFQKREILSVSVNLAEAEAQILALSRVVWVRMIPYKKEKVYRVGLMFLEMGTQDLHLIRGFILPALRAA